MVIYEQRGRFCFKNGKGKIFRFDTKEEAVEAGGIAPNEEVQVSGVPYKVPASSVASAVDDAADVMSNYEEEGDN